MTPEEKERSNQQSNNLIYFQNLVPGYPDSQLIRDFKMHCLEQEENEELRQYREQLLNNNPPILTFRSKKEEDEFYEKEAQSCAQFCCGSFSVNADNKPILQDNYNYSIGNGELYQGSSSQISTQIKSQMNATAFGSTKHEQYFDGLKVLNANTKDRETPQFPSQARTSEQSNERGYTTPFGTTPKPHN